MRCLHGGMVAINIGRLPAGPHSGGYPMLFPDTDCTVGGCAFPSPCVKVKWITGNRNEPLTSDNIGMCYNAQNIPQGRVRIVRI